MYFCEGKSEKTDYTVRGIIVFVTINSVWSYTRGIKTFLLRKYTHSVIFVTKRVQLFAYNIDRIFELVFVLCLPTKHSLVSCLLLAQIYILASMLV